jgi:hypothetical protein
VLVLCPCQHESSARELADQNHHRTPSKIRDARLAQDVPFVMALEGLPAAGLAYQNRAGLPDGPGRSRTSARRFEVRG